MNKTIIFTGAGASYGSEEQEGLRPSLGDRLLTNLIDEYPNSWGTVIELIQRRGLTIDKQIEIILKIIMNSQRRKLPILMRDMARYFAHFKPSDTSLFHRMSRTISQNNLHNDIIWSTLNYDCLQELSMKRFHLLPDYFDMYKKQSVKIEYWKLHGSCNFIPALMETGKSVNIILDGKLDCPLEPYPLESLEDGFQNLHPEYFPAMAIYTEGKPTFIGSGQIEALQNWWQREVLTAKRILIIGAKPNPDDTHIWNYIASTKGRLYYTGNSEQWNEWKKQYRRKKNDIFLANTFKEGIQGICNCLIEEK